MTKEQFRERTISTINHFHENCLEKAKLVISNMKDEDFAEFEDNYFLPKAFHNTLIQYFSDKITERSYTASFVRKYRKAVRFSYRKIIYNGLQ